MSQTALENPVSRLDDEQIRRAIEDALERGDRHFVQELIGELARRGKDIEL